MQGSLVPNGGPLQPPIRPLRVRPRAALPRGPGWAFEPKWDGFRALAWSAGRLDSRRQRSLLPFFPELATALAALPPDTILDGEIVVVRDGVCDFEALQRRLTRSPAQARALARSDPASFMAFDCLALRGRDTTTLPCDERYAALARLPLPAPWLTTPRTSDRALAQSWLTDVLAIGCEGVVAKPRGGRYRSGRAGWVKVKRRHTLDVVIAGIRLDPSGETLAALLLGLYDRRGRLHYVGAIRHLPDADRAGLLAQFAPLRTTRSFTGRRPDQERSWGQRRGPWFPVRPLVVAEVSADQVAGQQFRHGARLLGWRRDKPPRECTRDQLALATLAGRSPSP